MDELLQIFDTTAISTQSNEENKLIAYYKNNGRLGGQEERRKEILLAQKGNRQNRADKSRGILDLVERAGEKTVFRDTQKNLYRPSIYVAGFNPVSPSYRNALMMSEWLVERPLDFNDDWDVVPCPKGNRMLVVASNGSTKCYNKYGNLRFECRTALPGGNPCNPKGRKDKCCVIDCFYHEPTNTMHVLDILAWNSQPMTDGEAVFRNYWLCAQMSDIPELQTINKSNKMLFKLLPRIPCSTEYFNNFMMRHPQFEDDCPNLDGLLFYHRRGHYVSGETPLVGWLFPYMVQEILGSDIPVNPAYFAEMPKDYINQADYIVKFAEKQSKKSNGRRKPRSRFTSTNSMDTADSANVEQETKVSSNESDGTTVNENMDSEEVPQDRSSLIT